MPPRPPQPPPTPVPLPLDKAYTLLKSFNSFLTVAIHNILFYRAIYPPETFLSTRAYNLPVHQNRHPKVCSWVRDAVDAVAAQLAGGHVARIAVVIHSPLSIDSIDYDYDNDHDHDQFSPSQDLSRDDSQGQSQRRSRENSATAAAARKKEERKKKETITPGSVLERWLFDVSRFPDWPAFTSGSGGGSGGANAGAAKAMADYGRMLAKESGEEEEQAPPVGVRSEGSSGIATGGGLGSGSASGAIQLSWPDVDEQLRGALRRMAHVAEGMASLPERCTFTVAVELKEEGTAPIGHPQAWIPSEPNLQPTTSTSRKRPFQGEEEDDDDVIAAKTTTTNKTTTTTTTPIRSVGAGPLFFECWVEGGRERPSPNEEPTNQPTGAIKTN